MTIEKTLQRCEKCSVGYHLEDGHTCKVTPPLPRNLYCKICDKFLPSSKKPNVCSWDCHDTMMWIKRRKEVERSSQK